MNEKQGVLIQVKNVPVEVRRKFQILAKIVGGPDKKASQRAAFIEAVNRLAEHPDYKAKVKALSE